MHDIGEISRILSGRAEEIARYLLPDGHRSGSEWRAGDVNGSKGDSLGVHLTGAKAGVWADFSSGGGGDLIDLWAATKGLSLADALRAAKDYLGIQAPKFEGSRVKQFRKPEKPACKRPAPLSPVMEYLTTVRHLSEATINAYQIAEQDGGVMVLPFKRDGELVNIKYMPIERESDGSKKPPRFEAGCAMALFGWQAIPDSSREIVICEGEIDAMSWSEYGVPALSVPNGAKSFTWLENEFETLDRFETIYLSYDMDAVGRSGAAEAVDRLGRHRCQVVSLPFKDANECLQNGVSRDAMEAALVTAVSCDPAELKRASVFVDDVIDAFYPPGGIEPGFLPPWFKLHDNLRFRPGEFSLWTGFTGQGKTTLLNQVILSGMEQGERACVASLEIKPRMYLKQTTKQATGEKEPAIELIRLVHSWYDGKLWLFDLVGSAKADRIFEVFEYARRRYGITQFVIDSLMRCGIDEDDYNGQKRFADRCAEFSTSHDGHVHLVAHSRKKDNDNNPARLLDVKGTGTLTDLAHNVFSVWRNKEKERAVESARLMGLQPTYDVQEKPDALLVCEKSREGEWTGQAGLWFESRSQQFVEAPNQPPYIYVRPIEEMEEEVY